MTIHRTIAQPRSGKAALALMHIRSDVISMAGELGGMVTTAEVAHAVSREHGYPLTERHVDMVLQAAGWRKDDSGRKPVYHSPVAPTIAQQRPNARLVAILAADLSRSQRIALGGSICMEGKNILTAPDHETLESLRQLGLCGAVGEGGDDFTYAAEATALGTAAIASLCSEKMPA